uniref:Uncharacterized protein n=1 Tax=Physcomitrium patens TaxID=3218 RepID=A0A2K1JT49_PHYPA|nr:hypothetical protein PHYPA_014472 [Physcomitrium patens]
MTMRMIFPVTGLIIKPTIQRSQNKTLPHATCHNAPSSSSSQHDHISAPKLCRSAYNEEPSFKVLLLHFFDPPS